MKSYKNKKKNFEIDSENKTAGVNGKHLEDNRQKSIPEAKPLHPEQKSIQRKVNNTGLPDNLKSGIENLSGHSMDDVKVHYNSSQPAQLNAHAFAQGNQIHVASGQEKHLPHEAWHVAQQKQGRVKPTKQLKEKTNINDDTGLEKEADVMGAKAMQNTATQRKLSHRTTGENKVLQGVFTIGGEDVDRVIGERVDAYLQQHKPELVQDFNDSVVDRKSDYGELSDWLKEHGLDPSIVGSYNDELQIKSIREVFNEVQQKLKLPYNIWEMVSDLDLAGEYRAAGLKLQQRQYSTTMSNALRKGWVEWTSCFATSERLYNLLSKVQIMSLSAPANNQQALEQCMHALVEQISSIESEKICAVFRISFGQSDHSFTIAVQGSHSEVIQSFAGASGESLAFNIHKGKPIGTSELCGHLLNIPQPRDARKASSLKLFNGEIMLDKGADVWPGLPMNWSMGGMQQAKVIFQLVMQKAKANLEILNRFNIK